MKQIDEGGYVYARPYSEKEYGNGETEHRYAQEGITYRQLLVAHALGGMVDTFSNKAHIVILCHEIADAIIAHQAKEREGK